MYKRINEIWGYLHPAAVPKTRRQISNVILLLSILVFFPLPPRVNKSVFLSSGFFDVASVEITERWTDISTYTLKSILHLQFSGPFSFWEHVHGNSVNLIRHGSPEAHSARKQNYQFNHLPNYTFRRQIVPCLRKEKKDVWTRKSKNMSMYLVRVVSN